MPATKTVVEPEFLGIPKDENEYLKYEGTVTLFVGNGNKIEDVYGYEMHEVEPEKMTIEKLEKGLESVGVKCLAIEIIDEDVYRGLRTCKCVCLYNKPYQIYHSEFFIKGLTRFEESPEVPLEFGFTKRLD